MGPKPTTVHAGSGIAFYVSSLQIAEQKGKIYIVTCEY